jgi:hypothetical protein
LFEAEYVLVASGEVPDNEMAVVLRGSTISLEQASTVQGDADVLGRYAGHAGPYGVVRQAAVTKTDTRETA